MAATVSPAQASAPILALPTTLTRGSSLQELSLCLTPLSRLAPASAQDLRGMGDARLLTPANVLLEPRPVSRARQYHFCSGLLMGKMSEGVYFLQGIRWKHVLRDWL